MNGMAKMYEWYDDYRELCEKLKIKPKGFNDSWITHSELLKESQKDGRNKKDKDK